MELPRHDEARTPDEHGLRDGVDDEFGLVGPTIMVKIGSAALMLGGLLSVLAGLLIRIATPPYGWIAPGPWLMIVFGVAAVPVAGWFGRARDWAAVVGAVLAGLLFIVNGGWLMLGLIGYFVPTMGAWFHAWQLLAALGSTAAALLVPLGIKDAFVASGNRRRLLE